MKKESFDKLAATIREAGKIRRGQMIPKGAFNFSPANINAIRLRLNKSQSAFAFMIGVSVATLQNREQGKRTPEGPARALLKIADEKPEIIIEALRA